MRKLWGAAHGGTSSEIADRFGQSIESDLTFWKEDVEGSIAHALMLGKCEILPKEDVERLVKGLRQILEEGPNKLPRDVEDVHTAVEARLGELVGETAGKLHTARSRNDQVATDARLYLRSRLKQLCVEIKSLQQVQLNLAAEHRSTLMPGYTHQQPAQPITLGFHQLAHFWAMQRHGWRAEQLLELVNVSPLGSAALAGTGFPIDRQFSAELLGFSAPIPNALDATSDRSWALDALHLCAQVMIDLSRRAQELVLWSGAEYGFVRLHETMTTGSSIMPQKRNPDMAELIRGRTGRAIANWVSLATTMKALPLGYNRDTQDDKPALFESLDLVDNSLALIEAMLSTASWNERRMAESAAAKFASATDLADFLAAQGMPFRKAHELVGGLVRTCAERHWTFDDLNRDRLHEIAPEIPGEALYHLNPRTCVQARESHGGPGRKAIALQIRRARKLQSSPGFKQFV